MPNVFHRRTSSTSSTASKPPSVFRYTLILLKARPSISDIDAISVYSEKRSATSSSTVTRATQESEEYFTVGEERSMEANPIEEGVMGFRGKFWALCGRVVRWMIRITLLLLLVGIISFGILFVSSPPQRPTSTPTSTKLKDQEDESTTSSEPERKSQSQRRSPKDKKGWDSARSVLEEADSGSVTGSFKNAGMGAKMGRKKKKEGDNGLDVEDTCILQ